MRKKFIFFILIIFIISCGGPKINEQAINSQNSDEEAIKIYQEALDGMYKGNFLYASKKFSEAEGMLSEIDWASKSALMSSYCLYNINFYDQAILNLERFVRIYPASQYVSYAHYLIAIIYFEQISDEKKDLEPLIKADNKIDFFLKSYPNSEYAMDLRFKKDLIQNQLAAKELFVARFYISTKKWGPAINRLKVIVKD